MIGLNTVLHVIDYIIWIVYYYQTQYITILNTSSLLFEYGLRESTRIAFYIGVPRYTGIGSDPILYACCQCTKKPNIHTSIVK